MCNNRHDSRTSRAALVLLVVFAAFFGANTFFIHTHTDAAGRAITHSHPWMPGSSHSHSSEQATSIGVINTAMTAMEKPAVQAVVTPSTESVVIVTPFEVRCDSRPDRTGDGRAPPVV